MSANSMASDETPLAGKTVLLADDESRLRQVVSLMLEELGASVIEVESGEQAVLSYRTRGDDIDVVLLDVRMAGMGGLNAYREIRAIDPSARAVLSSGIAPDQLVLQEIYGDGGLFIEKPFDMTQLCEALRSVIES